jgi:CHASE3 domain sensor protein
MIRKPGLEVGFLALLMLMAWNIYLAVKHFKQMQEVAHLTSESSRTQADISSVLKDFTDMETGQRGYLLTRNPSYLQPYIEAKARITADFASLRLRLAHRPEQERTQELQLESLGNSEQVEMQRSISLREQGYRHRAFMLVDSNEGLEYMDKARNLLSSLTASENSSIAKLDGEKETGRRKAFVETMAANSCLLALTACLFLCIRYSRQGLENEAAYSKQKLAIRDLQLAKLTSALSNQARFETSALEENARLLLQNYGGFLPRQGQEYAEQIKETSAQIERLRRDLIGNADSNIDEDTTYECVA